MSATTNQPYDVVIVGGGPAGSTAAAVLAHKGRRVLIVERELFPRYHVGESLLPFCYFTLARIGMIERMKQSNFPRKHSVQFVTPDGHVSVPFYFSQHLDHEAATTWQVLRSEFDRMMLDNAREKGATVLLGATASDFVRVDGRVCGVRGTLVDGGALDARAPMTIDASGRAALAVTRNGWRCPDPRLDKVAAWTYFRGAGRDPGLDEGATTVAYLPEKGWFWYIPLPDDVVSVGIVAERDYLFGSCRNLPEIFCREVGKNTWIRDHLAPGRQFGKYYATREFSYRSRYCAEDGLLLAGDAFAFLDPVFSSGVYLALRSGELAAEAADTALERGDLSAAQFAPYAEQLCGEIEAMRRLVYAFYDESFSFGRLIKAHPDLRGDLTDCLIGNLQKDFSRLFAAAAEMTTIPEPLEYGRPRPHAETIDKV